MTATFTDRVKNNVKQRIKTNLTAALHFGLIITALGTPLGFLLGCASTYENPTLKLIPESQYFQVLESKTQKKQIYDGFMNILDFSATLLTSDVLKAQSDHNARIYQWNQDQYNSERSKLESDMAKETAIFLSFYVPERKHDDLSKNTSKWKIFLDVAGKRYEGKAIKQKLLLSELVTLYPHHTRWQTAYKIVFPVMTTLSENSNPQLTLTGPVTSATVRF